MHMKWCVCTAAFPGAAEELDVTLLEAGPQLALAERAAAELVSKARFSESRIWGYESRVWGSRPRAMFANDPGLA